MSSAWKNAFALTLLTIPMAECFAACPTVSEWHVNGNGNWGTASNWNNNCVPNDIGDSALLGLFPTVPVTIDLDISPTITTLTFDNQNGYTINNPAANMLNLQGTGSSAHSSITNRLGSHIFNAPLVIVFDNITINASDPSGILSIRRGVNSVGIPNLTFNGPGTLINDSLDSTSSQIQLPAGILTVNSGTFINRTSVTPATATGSLVIPGEYIQNGGLFENLNTAAILLNGRKGSELDVLNSFTLNSGTFSNFNTGSIGTGFVTNQIFGSDVFIDNNLRINNGRLENINLGSIAGAISAGARIRAGNLIVNNGVLHNQNDGPLTGNTLIGSSILITGLMTFNNGRVENINTSSSFFPNLLNVGSFIRVGDFLMQDGTLNNTNSGSFSAATGAEFDFIGDATINGGQVNNSNTGNLESNNGGTFGTDLFFNKSLHLVGGSLLNFNSGSIKGISFGSLVQANLDSTMDGGSINNMNSGDVGPGPILGHDSGVQFFFPNNFTQNKGTITNVNTGPVSGPHAIGALFRSNARFQMNGGTFTNRNEGPIVTDGIGSLLFANSIDITGGILTNTNTGIVSTDPSIGSLIQTFTLNISNGILINNDTVQANTITNQSLGVIAGTGVFENFITSFLPDPAPTILFTNNATVIPGDPFCGDPGTMTILGAYIQGSQGTLQINLKNASTFSRLHIEGIPGTANLDGTLRVSLADQANGFPGQHITILDATGGVFGTFSRVINNLPSTLTLEVEYFPNSVVLSLDPTMVDYLGGFTQALFTTVNQINNRIGWQLESVKRRMPKWDPEKCCYPDTNPWEIYIGPLGSVGRLNHEKDQIGARFTTIGGLIGVDYAMCEFGFGLEFDYEHIHAHGHDNWGKVDIDEAHASLYATYVPIWQPELAVNAIVGGGYEWYSFHRKIHVGQFVAKGSPNGSEFDALFGIEYDIGLSMNCDRYHLIPLASIQYILLNIDRYTEHKAAEFDMKFGHQRANSLRSTLGFRSNYIWECEDFSFVPEITLAWQREFLDKERDVHFTPVFFDLPGSSLNMGHSGRNIWMGGIDLQATFCGNYGIEASYDFEWNKRYTNNFFYLGFKYSF